MSILLKIVYINDIFIPIVAIFCNILLLWLIKTVKTSTLIHINYSLVPNCILDIITALLGFIVAPHVFHDEGSFVNVFGDLFGFMNFYLAFYLTALFVALIFISAMPVTISFYIRFLIICRDQKVTIRTMIVPYMFVFITYLIWYSLLMWFYVPGFEVYIKGEKNNFTKIWEEEHGSPPMYFVNKILTPSFLTFCGMTAISFFIAYSLIFYYSTRISTTLKTHIDNNQFGTKVAHKQILRTLFIQAANPFLVNNIPLILIMSKSFLGLPGYELSLILSIFLPWITVVNPIAAFIFIKPYRNYLKNMVMFVFKLFQRHSNTPNVGPVQNKALY